MTSRVCAGNDRVTGSRPPLARARLMEGKHGILSPVAILKNREASCNGWAFSTFDLRVILRIFVILFDLYHGLGAQESSVSLSGSKLKK